MSNSAFRLSLYVSAAFLVLGRRAAAVLALAGGSLVAYTMAGEERELSAPPATLPTPDNPFMNVLIGAPTARGPAADVTLDTTQRLVAQAVASSTSLPAAREDRLFETDHSQRAFYTTASTTVPNDQGSFASFLYASGPTVKERGLTS